MEIKVVKISTKNKELLNQAFDIRTTVFVIEQKVDKELEYDGLDEKAEQYLVYYNNVPAGTGRYRETDEGFKLERFAVYKKFRGKHIGANLLEAMLKEILPTEKKIYLNAQAAVVNFYNKYGFKRIGEMFIEANIEHYKMVYEPKQRQVVVIEQEKINLTDLYIPLRKRFRKYTIKFIEEKKDIGESINLVKNDFCGLIIIKEEQKRLIIYPFSPGFVASKIAKSLLGKNIINKRQKTLEKEISDFIIQNKLS